MDLYLGNRGSHMYLITKHHLLGVINNYFVPHAPYTDIYSEWQCATQWANDVLQCPRGYKATSNLLISIYVIGPYIYIMPLSG